MCLFEIYSKWPQTSIYNTIQLVWDSLRFVPVKNGAPRLRDKIWEWPGDEATLLEHLRLTGHSFPVRYVQEHWITLCHFHWHKTSQGSWGGGGKEEVQLMVFIVH